MPLFDGLPGTVEPTPALPVPTAYQDMRADYATTNTTLGKHPLAFIRRQLEARRYLRSSELAQTPHGKRVRHAGIVRMRQQPETASGVTFVTLEDEDGMTNTVVWKHVAQRQWRTLVESTLLGVDGRWERVEGVSHLIVDRMDNLDVLLEGMGAGSRDYR